MKHYLRTMLIVMLGSFLCSGCSTTIHVKQDMPFNPREGRINKSVALYVKPESQAFSRSGSHAGGSCTVEFGKALVPNATKSLSQVFNKVVILSQMDKNTVSQSGAEYLIQIHFNDNTEVQVGATTFASHKIIVSLNCMIADTKTETRVFQESVRVEKEKGSAAGYLPLPPFSTWGWQNALQEAAGESLQNALEKINDKILENKDKFR